MTPPQPVCDAVKRGRSVIPAGLDKRPLVPWKERQVTPATMEEVVGWQTAFNPPAWGIVTGQVSGIVVIDLDGDQGCGQVDQLGLNPHVRTGSGGFHIYVEHPGWPVPTLNGKSKHLLGEQFPGIDIRADGGYAIFYGRNQQGEYEILRDLTPDPITIIPPDLRETLGLAHPPWPDQPDGAPHQDSMPTVQGKVDADTLVERALERARHGEGRNNTGFWLACQLRDNEYHQADAEAIMRRFAVSVGPLNTKGIAETYTEADAVASLRQAYARPRREPWTTLAKRVIVPDLAVLDGLEDRAKKSSCTLDDPDVIQALAWLRVKQPGQYDDICRKLRKADVGKQAYEPQVREAAKWYLAIADEEEFQKQDSDENRFGAFTSWRSHEGTYRVERAKTFMVRHDRKGKPIKDGVANFAARILEEIALDDGVETTRFFVVDGMLFNSSPLPVVRVPVAKFNTMNWPTELWGHGPTIYAGMSVKDNMRVAIMEFSGLGVPRKTVFVHLGWRHLPSHGWAFLHAGGALGAANLLVDIESELQKYRLPADQGNVAEAMRLSLSILELGDPRITFPLWACVWRAPLCEWLSFLVVPWLLGESGTLKSSLAGVILSHFGGPFDKDNLPASWLDTENRLEQRAFLAKDCVLVIDDYFPEKHAGFSQELEKRASRLIRSIGNRQARGRLRSDLSARKSYYPRGIVLSTAEQIPNLGLSALARIFPIPFERGAIDKEKLKVIQNQASLLPYALRGYLEYVAPMGDELGGQLRARFEELRGRARIEGHDRLPEAVAHLHLGLEMGVGFALNSDAINEDRAKELLSQGWDIFMELAQEHGKVLREERPSKVFLNAIQEALASGRAYLADREGGFGDHCSGEKIGWKDQDGIYLLPDVAFGLVSKLLQHRGGLSLTDRALREMLAKDGLLLRKDRNRQTSMFRCEGKSIRVLWLRPDALGDLQPANEEGTPADEPSSYAAGVGP
jgi:hypothetical protein